MSERNQRRSSTARSQDELRHELRTALNHVLGLARILKERDLPAEERDLTDHLSTAAERLRRSIEQLFSHGGGQAPELGSSTQTPVSSRDDRRLRILVVDDEELNRLVSERDLRRLGYGVDAVADGREALEAFDRERYDLVLMDCRMPDLDGAETARCLREREGAERTPVVAFTASVEAWPSSRLAEVGMDDRLAKPYAPQQLQAVLRRWLGTEDDPQEDRDLESSGVARRDDSVIDRPTLIGLGAGGEGGEALPPILRSALRDLPARMERMERSLSTASGSELASAAHSMSGLSGMIGARQLARTCGEIGSRLRQGDLESCADLVSAARQHTAAVISELQRLLDAEAENASEAAGSAEE